MFVLWSSPNHTPIKFRCLIKKYNQPTLAYIQLTLFPHFERSIEFHLHIRNNKFNHHIPHSDLLMCSWNFYFGMKPLHLLKFKICFRNYCIHLTFIITCNELNVFLCEWAWKIIALTFCPEFFFNSNNSFVNLSF